MIYRPHRCVLVTDTGVEYLEPEHVACLRTELSERVERFGSALSLVGCMCC